MTGRYCTRDGCEGRLQDTIIHFGDQVCVCVCVCVGVSVSVSGVSVRVSVSV